MFYTYMLIVYLTILIIFIGLLFITDKFILTRLAADNTGNPAVMAWLDLWLPLIFSLPMGIILTFSGSAAAEYQAGCYAIGPSVGSACLAIGLVHFCCRISKYSYYNKSCPEIYMPEESQYVADNVSLTQLASYRHCFVMLLLGYVLIKIAEAANLAAWQGQIFITIAVIWIWMSSPQQPDEKSLSTNENDTSLINQPGNVNGSNNNNNNSNRWMLLDWAGNLTNPINLYTKIMITLLILILTAVCSSVAYFLNTSGINYLNYTITLTVLLQCFGVLLIAIRLDNVCAIRMAISTMVLSLTIGLGGMSMGLLIPYLRALYFPYTNMTTYPTHLMGMTIGTGAGIILIGLSFYLYLCIINDKYYSKFTGIILILAAIIVFLSGSSDFMAYLDGYSF